MAGYVYNQATVDIDTVTTYSTETTLFTVPSGKMFILKGLRIEGYVYATSAGATGALSFQLSNPAGDRFHTLTPLIDCVHGGSAIANSFRAEWCVPKDLVVTPLPTATPITGGLDAGDATDVMPVTYQSSVGQNMKFYPGQVLKFSPLDEAGVGIAGNVAVDIDLAVYAWWIEHTL